LIGDIGFALLIGDLGYDQLGCRQFRPMGNGFFILGNRNIKLSLLRGNESELLKVFRFL